MANFITTSITWGGKETLNYVFKPIFNPKDIFTTAGVRIMPDVQSIRKINYIGNDTKIAKAYSKGFSGATGTTYTQRNMQVYQMKAEMAQDANEFYQTVFEMIQGKGVEWNDIEKGGQALQDIVVTPFLNGLKSDIFRHFWLNDTNKETLDVNGFYSGTADTDYNAFDGIWKKIFDVASTTPTYANGDIYRTAISNGATAQVSTITLTGTSGTATVTQGGKTYLATFTTNLTTSATNFVTSHAAALLLRGIVVTSSGADVILTSAIAGQPFKAPTIANTSGDMSGSVAATQANVSAQALSADEILTTLDSLTQGCSRTLRALPANQKVILMDSESYFNYEKSLRSFNASTKFTIESGKLVTTDGMELLTYRGIPVINLDWDEFYQTDFPHASGENAGYPFRIIYTEINNLVLAIDDRSEYSRFEFWYDKNNQENRFRIQYKMGADYYHNELVAVAY